MKIAVPTSDGALCAHFGQCTHFAVFEVAADTETVTARTDLAAPEHQPGLFPAWLAEQGVTVVLAGGMGSKARELFAANDIAVVIGAATDDPAALVERHLAGALVTSPNICDK
jgi:predicted Fe-Mo cluster-binding NifX family protein